MECLFENDLVSFYPEKTKLFFLLCILIPGCWLHSYNSIEIDENKNFTIPYYDEHIQRYFSSLFCLHSKFLLCVCIYVFFLWQRVYMFQTCISCINRFEIFKFWRNRMSLKLLWYYTKDSRREYIFWWCVNYKQIYTHILYFHLQIIYCGKTWHIACCWML